MPVARVDEKVADQRVDGMASRPDNQQCSRRDEHSGDTENAAATDAVLNAITPIMSSRR